MVPLGGVVVGLEMPGDEAGDFVPSGVGVGMAEGGLRGEEHFPEEELAREVGGGVGDGLVVVVGLSVGEDVVDVPVELAYGERSEV